MDGNIRKIYGIGYKKADSLKKDYNIRDIQTLRKFVRKIPNIITDVQKLGLKYHNKTINSVSYKSAEKHTNFILKNIPNTLIAGSFRRKEKKIHDIDVLTTTEISRVVQKIKDKKYLTVTLSQGDEKFSGIVCLPKTNNYRRIDIIKTTTEQKPFALLYFTGDFIQNIHMRSSAKKKGYMLSQYGLKNLKSQKYVKGIKNERGIFKFLDMEYKTPEERIHSAQK
jgi:DNA polymerase (family 10)